MSTTMQAIQVQDFLKGPKPTSLPLPKAPASDEILLRVTAAGLHQVVKSRASGKHYSGVTLPHVPGIDGVGYEITSPKEVDVPEAKRQYYFFLSFLAGQGSFVEYITLPRRLAFKLPSNLDPLQAAALLNPTMSSWMGLSRRAGVLPASDNGHGAGAAGLEVLIVGATTMSGRMAVRVAHQLGAKKVYGAARDEAKLSKVEGLDGRIVLNDASPQGTDFSIAKGATVVLDYLYGPWPAAVLLSLGKTDAKHPLTWVTIGALAGQGDNNSAVLPLSAIAARDVTLRGSGFGAWDPRNLPGETPQMLDMLGGVHEDDVRTIQAANVDSAWNDKQGRLVFTF